MNPSSQETATPTTTANDQPVRAANANEWGQITGLQANAEYFVIRKPTQDYTREKSKALLHDAKSFLQANREFAEHQIKEMNEKYGEPAKAKVQEMRVVLEKRFDEMTKELETRFERIEQELGERGILRRNRDETTVAPAGAPGETPGEMPAGNGSATTAGAATKKKAPKNG